MNNYIKFDNLQYMTPAKAWKPSISPVMTPRVYLDGNIGATYGPKTVLIWDCEIEAPVTAASPWGSIADLKTSLAKRQMITLIDHYGVTYSVVASGPFLERSLSPKWDGASNKIYVKAKLTGVA